jgi:hypothetical protein
MTAVPITHRVRKERARAYTWRIYNTVKQIPPVMVIVQWVYPRHRISKRL